MKQFNQKIRIIPKLEIKNENLIKGIRFEGLRKVGDPIEFAEKYYKDGADQLNIIDIVASLYSRDNLFDVVNKITEKVFIPVCVGGGVKNIQDIKNLLKCGADRVILNSSVLRNPEFLNEVINIFGGQFITVSVEVKKIGTEYYCMMDHGRENSNKTLTEWLKFLNNFSIGEIIVNSIDNDGMEIGFDNDIYEIVKNSNISVPKVICGGASKKEDFLKILEHNEIEGIAAATCFHFKKVNISDLKKYLSLNRININNL